MTDLNVYTIVFMTAGLFLVLELVVLLFYRLITRRGITSVSLIANAGAGGCLLVAAGLSSMQISLSLTCAAIATAFIFHLIDQAHRWRS